MDKKIVFRIDNLLKHISLIEKDLDGKTLEDFKNSDLLVRAISFYLF